VIAWFWSAATYLTLGACVLVIVGSAVAFIGAILGWDRDEIVDHGEWQQVEDEKNDVARRRTLGRATDSRTAAHHRVIR